VAAQSQIELPATDKAVQGLGVDAAQIYLDAGLFKLLYNQLSLPLRGGGNQ